jgi:hypothetical protein
VAPHNNALKTDVSKVSRLLRGAKAAPLSPRRSAQRYAALCGHRGCFEGGGRVRADRRLYLTAFGQNGIGCQPLDDERYHGSRRAIEGR